MAYAAAYVIALVVFGVLDILYLSTIGAKMFRDVLGDILATDVRMGPAIAFYLLYPVGIVFFAVVPALRDASLTTAIVNGAMFGLLTYATYDLTNYATLKSWTLGLAVMDLSYGAALAAFTAAVAYLLTARWFA